LPAAGYEAKRFSSASESSALALGKDRIAVLRRDPKPSDYATPPPKGDDAMNEAAKTQAQAIFKRREAERAEFDAQLKAQRDKAQRLRALRVAREEARWVEHRPKVIEGIKEGLVMLHEKTAEMRIKHP
jgi:hypothetical protein